MFFRLLLKNFLTSLRLRRDIRRQRRDLLLLDDHLLNDIGVSREEALREAHRPLWEIVPPRQQKQVRTAKAPAIPTPNARIC